MNNIGVSCDVRDCVHHTGISDCKLAEIKVTQQCSSDVSQSVETPHFCKNYEKID